MDFESIDRMREAVTRSVEADRTLLDEIRAEISPHRGKVRRIVPRQVTSISLVAADGGNNQLRFDPFLVQLVRIVDSSRNAYWLEAISPTTNLDDLSTRQFRDSDDRPTLLGKMMKYLKVDHLSDLSHMIRADAETRIPKSTGWVQTYRELVEWAVLFHIIREKDFGTDTLVLYDGLLRSKLFAGTLFADYLDGIADGIERAKCQRRSIYLVGMAKHSKVLDRYRLAMVLEGILTSDYPAYLDISRELEKHAYRWSEYARGNDPTDREGEANKFVGGKMFFVKLGPRQTDAIWPVDVFEPQAGEAGKIFSCLLADAQNGFPVPNYPASLQAAHEAAALTGFDVAILQDQLFDGLRDVLAGEAKALDPFLLREADPAAARYS